MHLYSLMKNYVASNLWANEQYVNWLRPHPIELIEQIIPSSFPGIKGTLVHIWDTERFWLSVLEETPPPPSFRQHGFDGSTEAAYLGIVDQSRKFLDYLNSINEKELLKECKLDTPWVKGSLPKYEFVQHSINHSTYHRGQIVTMAHHLGIKGAPMTDYNFYNMMVKKNG